MEGDFCLFHCNSSKFISIHSLRMEGDGGRISSQRRPKGFQSTPSAWRETCPQWIRSAADVDFNPLPPHGGRPCNISSARHPTAFQSTPSAWRETSLGGCARSIRKYFNPLPPHGGRREDKLRLLWICCISIHSLRMEGDRMKLFFQPVINRISIHSLRMEGDMRCSSKPEHLQNISIHSLRMEGDLIFRLGQRLGIGFQSTPSAWRETAKLHRKAFFISPILVQSCKKGCKRLHSAPEKMVFFEKREKNLVRNLQHLSVRL